MRHVSRALIEGVAFRLRSLDEILCEIVGDIREIRASGGFTHSDLWPQIMANTLNHELIVPTWGETSCLGAAFWAMRGLGAMLTFDNAQDFVSIDRRYVPVPKDAARYNRLYDIYTGLYNSASATFDQIADYQKEFGV
jgi:gluconokinase